MNFNAITQPLPTPVPATFNGKVSHLITDLLTALGEDPGREGLARTPERVSRMYDELLSGYHMDLKTIVNGALFVTDNTDIVVVEDIDFTSMCEHHLLPFYGRAHVAYVPDGTLIGLSKIPRIVEMFARRLQIQERMTEQIADAVQEVLAPRGVGVVVEGVHLCAQIRGVKKSGMRMRSRHLLGELRENGELRREFLDMVLAGRKRG